MTIAFTKLTGLDEARLLGVVEPILKAHRVDGVELIWRTGQKGMVLELTIEKPDTQTPGVGVTIDLCSEISRDLSAALDAGDIIGPRYTLEVGSPGVERSLYSLADCKRFAGQLCKIKLRQPLSLEGPLKEQRVLRGTLFGLDEQEKVLVETEQGMLAVDWDNISNARLVFDWNRAMEQGGRSGRPAQGSQKAGQQKPRTNKRST